MVQAGAGGVVDEWKVAIWAWKRWLMENTMETFDFTSGVLLGGWVDAVGLGGHI